MPWSRSVFVLACLINGNLAFAGAVDDAPDDDGSSCLPEDCVDADGDGYYTCEYLGRDIDCDDNNPLVKPNGDPDWCGLNGFTGVDNDCDGLIDEDFDCEVSLIGTVCLDLDGNGIYTEGVDDVLEGYTVVLRGPDCSDRESTSELYATSNRLGTYYIEGLCYGDWEVEVVLQDGDYATASTSASMYLPIAACGVDLCITRQPPPVEVELVTRTQGWWKHHACVIETLLPISVGTLYFDDARDVVELLNRPVRGDKSLPLTKQLLVAYMGTLAFGTAGLEWDDLDGDGDAETIADLIAAGAEALASHRNMSHWSDRLDALNNAATEAPLPEGIPEQCFH